MAAAITTKGVRTLHRHLAAKRSDIPEGGKLIVDVKGMQIGLFQIEDRLYAWRNVCPHAAAPVCRGRICGTRMPSLVYEYEYGRDNQILRCPWHGWEFDLTNGQHLVQPDVKLRGFPVETDGDDVYILL